MRMDQRKRTISFEGENNYGGSIIKLLQTREISCKPRHTFVADTASHRFQKMRLTHQFPTHDDQTFLMNEAHVKKIFAAKNIVFVLSHYGIVKAFSRVTNEKICTINLSADEVISRLFHNKHNDSVITVSRLRSQNSSPVNYRSTLIEYIRRAKPDAGFPLFESESLKSLTFVEFDDLNATILTHSGGGIFKVFDLKNYTLLYAFSDRSIRHISFCLGVMLLTCYREIDHNLLLKIISIEDGTVFELFHIHLNNEIEFIHQLSDKVLLKRINENVMIIDLQSSKEKKDKEKKDKYQTWSMPTPAMCLRRNQMFITTRNRQVTSWNLRTMLDRPFEDHLLWHPEFSKNKVCTTSDEDLIISLCKEFNACSIHVSNALTGYSVAIINSEICRFYAYRCDDSCSCKRIDSDQKNKLVEEALKDITALFYDEDRHEIYTGNSRGIVNVWSNSGFTDFIGL